MALTKCRECGHEISKSAKTCPGCGAHPRKPSIGCLAMLAVVLLMALIAQLNPSRNASANINAYPLQPSINARADAIALYKQKTELTTLCDVAGGLRAIAMLGTDKITLYQEAKKEDSNCLGISTKLHDIQIPQSLGRPVAAAFAQAMDHCQSAYLSQWSAAHSLESALDDGKAGDMAAFRDRQANMLSENAVCSRGLISAADLLGVTRAELESGLLNGAREGQLQTQPTGAIGNSSDQSGSTDSYHSATTTNLTDYNFEDYPSERFMGPNVNPDFSGKQRPFRQYRTAIRDSVKQGPVFAGSVAVAEVGCGTDCGSICSPPPFRSPLQGGVSSIGGRLSSLNDFACARTRTLIQNRHGPCIPPRTFA